MTKRLRYLIAAPAVFLIIGLVVPAWAESSDGTDSTSSSTGSSSTTDSSNSSTETATTSDNSGSTTKETKDSTSTTDSTQKEQVDKSEVDTEDQQFEAEGQGMVASLQKDHTTHSATAREQACTARQHGLETMLSSLQKNASAYKQKIDQALSGAETYQTNNKMQVADWSQLVAAAQSAQSTTGVDVAALNGLSVSIDCSSPSVAQTVATFKAADQKTRTDLLAYRTAVINILTALDQAQGGNQ